MSARTHDGRGVRLLTLIDEFTREALTIKVKVARRLNSVNVIEAMADVMVCKGVPEHIRSDNVLTLESSATNAQQIPRTRFAPF